MGRGKHSKSPSIEKERVEIAKEGIIVKRNENLSNFTIDKPIIDFFKHALHMTEDQENHEKARVQFLNQTQK